MRSKRRRRQPYISGYCAYAPHQHPCPGELKNGSLTVPRVTLCSCSCHGDYEQRLIAAGQTLAPEEPESEDDDE